MTKPVIFVESPNKAPHIAEYSGMDCVATKGHFGDMPEKDLGINLQNYELTFEYKGNVVADIRKFSKGRSVYLAADPDREGYAINFMIALQLQGIQHGPVKFVEIHSVTEQGVAQALKQAVPWEQTNFKKYDAYKGRRGVDRLAGYGLSKAAREHFKACGYSVGRLQSPALRLLVDRAREIQNFKPTEFWRLFVNVQAEDGQEFVLEYLQGRFDTQAEATAILTKIQAEGASGAISKIEQKPTRKNPPAPFTMSTMTQAANARLGMTTKEAASIAQALFEPGFITYPRSDSVRIEPEPLEAIREAIKASFGADAVPHKANQYKSKNSQADAHEAIRPTSFVSLEDLPELFAKIRKAGLGEPHCQLFGLIYRRTLASQMNPALYAKTTIDATFAGEDFRASGSVLQENGYLAIYSDQNDDPKDDEGHEANTEQIMPAVEVGQRLQKTNEELRTGKTKPPAHHTEGTLVKALEDKGIGRPSTYSPAVERLKQRGYAEPGAGRLKGRLLATAKGHELIDYLAAAWPWIIDYDLTRQLEEQLDQVQDGLLPWTEVLKSFHARMNFMDPRAGVFPSYGQTQSISLGKCPVCNGEVLEKKDFYGCANYQADPPCRFTLSKIAFGFKIEAKTASSLLLGKPTRKLKLKRKDGSGFEARLAIVNGKLNPIFEN